MPSARFHRRLVPALLLLAAAAVLPGCGRKQPTPAAPSPAGDVSAAVEHGSPTTGAHLPPGIDWFQGPVDAAFAAAKAAPKPLFLYWGAEWCPPCAQVKATIFNRREFQERSRLFVPVYLDGDTPSAQKQAERFGVVGYPTMILFRPDGTEITRLPGGVDIERYSKILDVALADARPVKDILAAATGGSEVTRTDWQLLAYYDWPADNGRLVPEAGRVRTFRILSERCPADMDADCARLYFEYLGAAAATADKGKSPLTGLDRAIARKHLTELLGSPAVDRANVNNLLYAPKSVIGLLSDAGSPERRELTSAWSAALDRVGAADGVDALSSADQIKLLRARVMLAQLDAPDAPLPPALTEEIRRAVARVDTQETDAYARQAAINAAANLYWTAGMGEDGNRLLLAELGTTKSPYYFMLNLADIAKKAGHKEEAVQWLAKAYAGAQGPATRFQWGYDYLIGLLEMTPEDTKTIESTGLQVIGELGDAPDAFYQRTRVRLDELSTRLLDWGKTGDRAKVVDTLRKRTAEVCAGLPDGDEGRANCERFLRPSSPATRGA
jgi:thiol-disulfide isomerase/thioredoxin